MQRITDKDLKAVVERINLITGMPLEAYTKDKNGKLKANVGNYHLSYAYGGVCLHRMHNDAGGVNTPINSGFTTKRDLYNQMQAYIKGLVECREVK